jgi:hypothetical protein
MRANSVNTDSDSGPTAPATGSTAKPSPDGSYWESFLRVLIVGFGIVAGVILSFVIAAFAGWIRFEC